MHPSRHAPAVRVSKKELAGVLLVGLTDGLKNLGVVCLDPGAKVLIS